MSTSKLDQQYQHVFEKFKLDKHYLEKEYVNRYNFKTKNSADIKYGLLKTAESVIDRKKGHDELMKYVPLEPFADQIEKGLFEFSLIFVIMNKLQDHFVNNVYLDKLYDLCSNIDIDNVNLENNSLLPKLMDGTLMPYLLSFYPYDVLYPERWAELHLKREIRNEVLNNFQTSDLYKCSRCGERKFKITEVQLRSADESSSQIIMCLVCNKTFIR